MEDTIKLCSEMSDAMAAHGGGGTGEPAGVVPSVPPGACIVTWRQLIETEMAEHGDAWESVVDAVGGDPGWQDRPFQFGYGLGSNGAVSGFTLWTKDRVYFARHDDGLDEVCSVPRNPSEEVVWL